jgi:hypothetical protein
LRSTGDRESDTKVPGAKTVATVRFIFERLSKTVLLVQQEPPTRWFLVVGSHERDNLFAAALKRAAHRFGAKIVQEREFTSDHRIRFTARPNLWLRSFLEQQEIRRCDSLLTVAR